MPTIDHSGLEASRLRGAFGNTGGRLATNGETQASKTNIDSAYPQKSLLRLSTRLCGGRSLVNNLFFTPPFKILSPFYENYNEAFTLRKLKQQRTIITMILVSAGIMAGDSQEIRLEVGDGCDVKLESQSFEKIHDMRGGHARRDSFMTVMPGAKLVYAPLPTIPFANSSFSNRTEVHLDSNSRLYYSDIFSCGRVGLNELFAFRFYESRLKVFMQDRLIFLDNMILDPAAGGLGGLCLFKDFTHYLSLVIIDSDFDIDSFKSVLASMNSKNLIASISALPHGYCLRALARGSEILIALRDRLA